jgi:hypothetical protein
MISHGYTIHGGGIDMRGRDLWYCSLAKLPKSRIGMMHGVLALDGKRKRERLKAMRKRI